MVNWIISIGKIELCNRLKALTVAARVATQEISLNSSPALLRKQEKIASPMTGPRSALLSPEDPEMRVCMVSYSFYEADNRGSEERRVGKECRL